MTSSERHTRAGEPRSGFRVAMLGATGAVGSHVARTLVDMTDVVEATLLGRRPLTGLSSNKVRQETVDVFDPSTYEDALSGASAAICTLGIGEPSAVSREEFVKVDKTAVLSFASSCKRAGVRHFQLLGSVGANARSLSFYLRTKGELEQGLEALGFARLSLFRPSMILTPTNRYGLSQALTLAVWPRLNPLFFGPLRKLRGIPVDRLGRAIALNLRSPGSGVEVLHWDQIDALGRSDDRG